MTEKHSKDYTVEQIRSWAHMVQMGKHLPYDEPPGKPFFRNKKVKNDKRPSQLSPKKRIELHTECMEQLQK